MEHWISETRRDDGLYIHKLGTEFWAIRVEGRVIERCPCCDRPFVGRRAAQKVADAFCPVRKPPANGGPPEAA